MYHARLQHMVMRQGEARRQAGQLVEESHSSWFGTIDVLQNPTDTMAKIQSTMQRICQIHQCQLSEVIQLTILNWSAPCLIASYSGQLDGCTHQWLRASQPGPCDDSISYVWTRKTLQTTRTEPQVIGSKQPQHRRCLLPAIQTKNGRTGPEARVQIIMMFYFD